MDTLGSVYVADSDNNLIRQISPTGTMPFGDCSVCWKTNDLLVLCVGVVIRLAGGGSVSGSAPGFADGNRAFATFQRPVSIAVDTVGVVYVADTDNCLIRKISIAGKFYFS